MPEKSLKLKILRSFMKDFTDIEDHATRKKINEHITKDGQLREDTTDHTLQGYTDYHLISRHLFTHSSRNQGLRLLFFKKGGYCYLWKIIKHDEYEKLSKQKVKLAFEGLDKSIELKQDNSNLKPSNELSAKNYIYTTNKKEMRGVALFSNNSWTRTKEFLTTNLSNLVVNEKVYIVTPYLGDTFGKLNDIGMLFDNQIIDGAEITLITLPPIRETEFDIREKLKKKYKKYERQTNVVNRNKTRKEKTEKKIFRKMVADFKVTHPDNLKKCIHINRNTYANKTINKRPYSIRVCNDCKRKYGYNKREIIDDISDKSKIIDDEKTKNTYYKILKGKDAGVEGRKTPREIIEDLEERGIKVYFYTDLHTKLYYFKRNINRNTEHKNKPNCYIGSANFSKKGIENGSMELGIETHQDDGGSITSYLDLLKNNSKKYRDYFELTETDRVYKIVEDEVYTAWIGGKKDSKAIRNLVEVRVKDYYKKRQSKPRGDEVQVESIEKSNREDLTKKLKTVNDYLEKNYSSIKNETFSV